MNKRTEQQTFQCIFQSDPYSLALFLNLLFIAVTNTTTMIVLTLHFFFFLDN